MWDMGYVGGGGDLGNGIWEIIWDIGAEIIIFL